MINYRDQYWEHIPYTTYGDLKRWGRYKRNSKIRRIIRDIKWLPI